MSDNTDPGSTGDGFDDPTAPAWTSPEPAPPTPPVTDEPPVPPPSPYAAAQPAPAKDPYTPAPYGQNPYGQNPYGQNPYGQGQQQPYDPPAYGQTPYTQPYGSTAYGQAPYSLPPAPYGAPPVKNTSAIVLTVVSGIATVLCCFFGVPSLVVGIVALTRHSTDPQGSARLARYGWITFAVMAVLAVAVVIGFIAFGTFEGSIQDDYEGL